MGCSAAAFVAVAFTAAITISPASAQAADVPVSHMAEHQDAWLVARRITAHQQNVAERLRRF